MKMSPVHYAELKSAIFNAIDTITTKSGKSFSAIHQEYKDAGHSDMRFRWDIFWASKFNDIPTYRSDAFKEYYDTHIDTALKKIVSEYKHTNPVVYERSEDQLLDLYLYDILWASMDDDGEPMYKNYSISDFSEEAIEQARKDLKSFFNRAGALLYNLDEEKVVLDFWLTRNRHGAGFWDTGDYPEHIGTPLTELSHNFGEQTAYVGDDGLIYFG
jgi:hypothetical protein